MTAQQFCVCAQWVKCDITALQMHTFAHCMIFLSFERIFNNVVQILLTSEPNFQSLRCDHAPQAQSLNTIIRLTYAMHSHPAWQHLVSFNKNIIKIIDLFICFVGVGLGVRSILEVHPLNRVVNIHMSISQISLSMLSCTLCRPTCCEWQIQMQQLLYTLVNAV